MTESAVLINKTQIYVNRKDGGRKDDIGYGIEENEQGRARCETG